MSCPLGKTRVALLRLARDGCFWETAAAAFALYLREELESRGRLCGRLTKGCRAGGLKLEAHLFHQS